MHKQINNQLNDNIKKELVHFEQFFHRMGFKRLDGAIWGLLAISEEALNQEQIESELSYSQSAISLSLKNLDHYGAIESRIDSHDIREIKDNRERRVKVYSAKEDALAIVASVFKKREEETIVNFRKACIRLLNEKTNQSDHIIQQRLTSIISTCQIAESVIDFVIKASDLKYHKLVKKLPETFDLLLKSTAPLTDTAGEIANDLGSFVKKGIRTGLSKLIQEKSHTENKI